MKRALVSAPGKLHLLGEHTVVHERSAIITAVDKRCFVEISSKKGKRIRITSENFKKEVVVSFTEILTRFEKAQKKYEAYTQTNDIALLKSITKGPYGYALLIIGQYINYFKLNSIESFDLKINSQIPIGSGMGSSGALAVSIIGALCLFTNQKFDKEIINKIAYLCEQKKHGNPSGGDNTVSCFGGLIWYKKGEKLKPLNIKISKNIAQNFYIANTGKPAETTGEMVSRVKSLLQKDQVTTQSIFDDQEKLVKNLLVVLKKGNADQIQKIIKQGEGNLEKLGVVSIFVQKIIRDIESSNGAAKICGGGGIKKGTGIILIYSNNLSDLKKVLKTYQLISTRLLLGAEGLRAEKISDTI